MQNKQTREDIILWHRANKLLSDQYHNICKCGSLLTIEHMTDCRIYRQEVSRLFRTMKLTTSAVNILSDMRRNKQYEIKHLDGYTPDSKVLKRRQRLLAEEITALDVAIQALLETQESVSLTV